jgi:hypothetical protein
MIATFSTAGRGRPADVNGERLGESFLVTLMDWQMVILKTLSGLFQ